MLLNLPELQEVILPFLTEGLPVSIVISFRV